jgi:tetratricopeptide (TPR) repeat protein
LSLRHPPANASLDEPSDLDAVRGLYRSGRHEEALAACRRLISVEPGRADLLGVAAMLAAKLGDLARAEADYRAALALDPNLPELSFNFGNLLAESGRTEEASVLFRRAVALAPALVAAHNNLASALHRLRDYEGAAASYARAIELAPSAAHLHRNLGTLLRDRDDLEGALACFERAVALKPAWTRALQSLATTAMELGRWQRAVEACERWLTESPANVEALGLLSIAFTELGDDARADELLDFERLVRIVELDAPPQGFASLAEFNAALARHALDHPTLHVPPIGDPRYHCPTLRMTSEFCAEPKGPAAALERWVEASVAEYTASLTSTLPSHPFVAGAPPRVSLHSWAAVLDGQGQLEPHVHYASYVSAVYYPQIPQGMAHDAPDAGWFEFSGGPSRFPCRRVRPPRAVEPREGRLLLFPSYFYHRTRPFSAGQPRISIAFDAVPAS